MSFLLLCNSLLTGCLPASPGSGRPERKKMFTLDQADSRWEGNRLSASGTRGGSRQSGAVVFPPLPFALSDTLLQVGGGLRPYLLVHLSSGDYDLLLLGAKTYEGYLPGWLKAWPQTGREGIIIDLSAGKPTGRDVFQFSTPDLDNPVPLVLQWDAGSEARAHFYTQLLQNLTTIKISQ